VLAPGARRLVTIALLFGLAGCKTGGCVANVLGDIVGDTGDVAYDRRFVQAGKERPALLYGGRTRSETRLLRGRQSAPHYP
jgi:hypothetical protein